MIKAKQRILFLSLGTGAYSINTDTDDLALLDSLKNGNYNYRTAKYSIAGTSEYRETPFIAEVLVESYNPNKIYIIGSVKSAWSGIFYKYCDAKHKTDINAIKRLIQIEKNHGITDDCSDLDCLQDEINIIFAEGNVRLTQDSSTSAVIPEVLLIRYGINENELFENYARLNAIWARMNDSCDYDVAFDITHSFRSLPIYNLILLNYYRHLAHANITISHIYYGMVEVSRENDGIAPIVDLKKLLNILDRTNGVSEFRNTGNTVTLAPLIDNEAFKNCFSQLDWATQINDFNKINDALIRIGELDQSELDKANRDIYNMTIDVLNDKLLDNAKGEFLPSFESKSIAEKQYMLSRWYQRQNRYGIAIATGLEALRSMLVPLYLSINGLDVTQNLLVEKYRKNSIARLSICTQHLASNQNHDKICTMLCDIESVRLKAKAIRDRFAHNLANSIINTNDSTGFNNSERDVIDTFLDKLQDLKEALDNSSDKAKILRYYAVQSSTVHRVAISATSYTRIIIGSFDDSTEELDTVKQLERGSNRHYDVYTLSEGIQEKLKEDKGTNKSRPRPHLLPSARFLKDYLISHFTIESFTDRDSKVFLIFYNLKPKQKIYYASYLQYMGFESTKMFYLADSNSNVSQVESLDYITDGCEIQMFDNQVFPDWGLSLMNEVPVKLQTTS